MPSDKDILSDGQIAEIQAILDGDDFEAKYMAANVDNVDALCQTVRALREQLVRVHSPTGKVGEPVSASVAPTVDAISRADAIAILQDAREHGSFDLRGLIAELKGLPAAASLAAPEEHDLTAYKVRNNKRRDEDLPELREAVDDIYRLLGWLETRVAAKVEDARVERLTAQLNGVMNSLAISQREVERLRAINPSGAAREIAEQRMRDLPPSVACYQTAVRIVDILDAWREKDTWVSEWESKEEMTAHVATIISHHAGTPVLTEEAETKNSG